MIQLSYLLLELGDSCLFLHVLGILIRIDHIELHLFYMLVQASNLIVPCLDDKLQLCLFF